MSAVDCYAGVDLGTSGLKVTVIDGYGNLLGESEEGYAIRAPQDGWSESDPNDWVSAYKLCVATVAEQLDGRRPAAVGFAGQMHGVVLSGARGDTLRPAVLWPDRRAEEVLGRWRTLDASDRARLGNPIVAGMAGPILTWLSANEATVVDRTTLARSPKDWLRGQLTGDSLTEPSDASATLLWDVVSGSWSEVARALAGVGRNRLPDLAESSSVCGTVDWEGHPVAAVVGGADTACVLDALRGVRGVDRESLIVNLGTGIQVLSPHESPHARADSLTHQYLDTSANGYEMLAIQNGGLALTWALSTLQCDWDDAIALAREVPPGCNGVSFVPFLSGERGHLATPDSRAAWVGMTEHTERSTLVRSAFEATAFSIRRAREMFGGRAPVVLTGGGGRDPFVRQLVADVLAEPLDFVGMRSATAIGAAVVAARGMGQRVNPQTEPIRVVPAYTDELEEAYQRWRRLADALA